MDHGPEAPRGGDLAHGKQGGLADMRTGKTTAFSTGIILAMTLATAAAFAQGVEDDDVDLMPAVDTSATTDARAAEIDALEPGVSSPTLASDVSRDTTGGAVMDSIELGRTEITGNQELPKVLYIVPWQKSDPGELMGKPVNTLLDDVLAPIDREEFLRQVEYYDDLYGDTAQE